MTTATAIAHPNIALIKYWGDIDESLHIPANGSISMNLAGLETHTSVQFDPSLEEDFFTLDGKNVTGSGLKRVSDFLERVRTLAGICTHATAESWNNFPMGTGIASSASGFAALAVAASKAAGLELEEKALTRLARTGSGSACRSIPAGFVEWQAGSSDGDSFAYSIAPPEHWDLVDCIVVVSQDEKSVSSSMGHLLASTSILQASRVKDAPHRLDLCREAILKRDFDALAQVVELDSSLMHAVMMTSDPPLFYWEPVTITIIQTVHKMRKNGLPVCYTIDAGPNVHLICPTEAAKAVIKQVQELSGVIDVLRASPGGPTRLEIKEFVK